MKDTFLPAGLSKNNPAVFAKSRKDNYEFFAGIFRSELTGNRVETIINNCVLRDLKNLCPELDDSVFLKPIDEVTETLAVEYTYLFIGPGKHISPYESVHVKDEDGKTGLLWGKSTVDFKAWVEHYGLKLSEKYESIPDHFCAILEFMGHVVGEEQKALKSKDNGIVELCRKVETEFFFRHIANWIPGIFEQVMEATRQSFYREMARLAHGFLKMESNLL